MKHKKITNILILLLTAALILGCEESTGPGDGSNDKPPGYQEEIPWPSLADSPWPMYHSDPQNTGRSKYTYSNSTLSIVDTIEVNNLLAGCVLGENSVYFNNSLPSNLFSVDKSNLLLNWKKYIGMEALTTPVITSNKIHTVGDNSLLTYTHSGDPLWSFDVKSDHVYQRTVNIDQQGNIYLVSDNTLYKLDQNGNLLNELTDARIKASNTPPFSPDGQTLYLQGYENTIIAVDVNGLHVKWNFGDNKTTTPPVVDSHGNIYVLPWSSNNQYYLYSINQQGNINWKFKHNEKVDLPSFATPAIGKNGDIYFGSDTLYSVAHNGKANWKLDIKEYGGISSITVDANNDLFVGTFSGNILNISKTGDIDEKVIIPARGKGFLPVVISQNQLYAPAYKGDKIFVIK